MSLIGIDPGARATGLLAHLDDGTVIGVTVRNEGPLLPLTRSYLRSIMTAISDLVTRAGADVQIKVEGITRPNWHVGKNQGGGAASNPEALIGTAEVLGAVTAHWQCEIVPPGKNGSRPLGEYPPELVSAGEKRHDDWKTRVGTGKLRHQRSAWDVAHYRDPRAALAPRPGPAHRPGPKVLDITVTDFAEGRKDRRP